MHATYIQTLGDNLFAINFLDGTELCHIQKCIMHEGKYIKHP